MAYTKKTWVKGSTPLSAENFNHMEQGIADAHTEITQLNSDKVDKADKANVKWIITGIDTSAKIIFSNCSEITKKVDKLACLLFGNSNGGCRLIDSHEQGGR